ncbi:DNA polymerase epsilon subunit 3-like [Oscarella lobularis]|uniref:DNA polymerase epsilon subunit 3-like n=1 Tax=Oscarella lobularis TaxID=121494 RepID=UPI0033142F20
MGDKVEDLSLPAAVIGRLIKEAIPDGTQVNVSKEARAAIGKAASVFILYATSCANIHAVKCKRKTLTGSDVLAAMTDMEFSNFVPALQEALEAFKKEQKDKSERKKKVAAAAAAAVAATQQSSATTDDTAGSHVAPEGGAGGDSCHSSNAAEQAAAKEPEPILQTEKEQEKDGDKS